MWPPARFTPACGPHVGNRLTLVKADAAADSQVATLMEGVTGVLCALPYYFNLPMARLAGGRGRPLHGSRGPYRDRRASACPG